MKFVFIYGSNEGVPALLEPAKCAVMKAHPLRSSNHGIVVLDRYGVEQEVMNVCQQYSIPLVVIGTTTRPRSSISMRYYERAILTVEAYQNREAQLRRYAVSKANTVVVLGDTPDCQAMRLYARTVKKDARAIEHVYVTTNRLEWTLQVQN